MSFGRELARSIALAARKLYKRVGYSCVTFLALDMGLIICRSSAVIADILNLNFCQIIGAGF